MPSTPGNSPNHWPTTQWTLIDMLADSRGELPSEQEIGDFLKDYLPPLESYLIHRRGLKPQDAEDLLQEFILQRFLSRELARHVDQKRGRFRTFLLTSLDNFLRNQIRRDRAQKRSPGSGLQPLEDYSDTGAGHTPTADDLFEIEWARMIVRQSVMQVKQHCEETGRPEVWQAFEARVIGPIIENISPTTNDELARRLGIDSPQQVSNAVATAKRIYKRAMHGVIVKYARNEDEVKSELDDLREILARPRS